MEEVQYEKHFISTQRRDVEGQFIIKFSLKDNIESLGKSYNVAKRRLRTLEGTLDKQPDLKQYHEFLLEYLESYGPMTKVQENTASNCASYYIPYYIVIKEDSMT